jgi:mannose-6-phosphate isomerase-like protein (cupin superfamily)
MTKKNWVQTTRHVPKPWGHEEHFALVDGLYCGKVLFVIAGHSLSLQLHEHKDETVAVHEGHLVFEVGHSDATLERFDLWPGEAVRITPGTVHRMTAVVDTCVLEVSTTELDDVIRLADHYGREVVRTQGAAPHNGDAEPVRDQANGDAGDDGSDPHEAHRDRWV